MGQGSWVLRALTNITRDDLLFVTRLPNGGGGYGRIITAIDGYSRQCLLAWLQKVRSEKPRSSFFRAVQPGSVRQSFFGIRQRHKNHLTKAVDLVVPPKIVGQA